MRSSIAFLSFLIISLCLYLYNPEFVSAGTSLVDPNIPHGEKTTYTSRTGNTSTTVIENVVIKRDGGGEIYEITSRSESLDKTVIFSKETMALLSVHTVRKYQDAVLDSQLTVSDKALHQFRQDEVKLADFSVLMYILRGFPFGKTKKLKIVRYGDKNREKFAFDAKHKKTEKVKVNQKTIDCYKLEISMGGFWGTFIPKTNIWYSVVPPHYLVRYEGPGGPPGSPKRNMKLVSYDVIE